MNIKNRVGFESLAAVLLTGSPTRSDTPVQLNLSHRDKLTKVRENWVTLAQCLNLTTLRFWKNIRIEMRTIRCWNPERRNLLDPKWTPKAVKSYSIINKS